EPTMRQIAGAPSSSVNVLVTYQSGIGFGATYASWSNTMTLSGLPATAVVSTGRANALQINEYFIHQIVHAFQDKALDVGVFDSFGPEGTAVLTTSLIRELHPTLVPPSSVWQLSNLAINYDHLSQMPGAALAGESYFGPGPRINHQYLAAGGLFLFITASQTSPQSPTSPDWHHYDHLS